MVCRKTIRFQQKAGKLMKPRPSSNTDLQGDLFRVELESLVSPEHPLVKLAGQIDWAFFERQLGAQFCETNGAPAKPVRLMVGLHYLKHTYNLSDEQTVARWVENPYWQHFCGEKWFQHEPPINPSSMTRWRKKIGEQGAEKLLAESIAAGLRTQTIKPASLVQVNVDTTVQEKALDFPTDACLYYR
jgi:IS5 family transposase